VTISLNTRVSYLLTHIANRVRPVSAAGHAQKIIFLTADAFGVFPPVSQLTGDQIAWYFLSGFTSKLAGTERGISAPTPTFSACFGAAFLTLHPDVYADVLLKRISQVQAQVWLVNTGWNGRGERISIKDTRAIINAILGDQLDDVPRTTLPVFNLSMPLRLPGVNSQQLDPRNSWESHDKWHSKARELAAMFHENFRKFSDTERGKAIADAGPERP